MLMTDRVRRTFARTPDWQRTTAAAVFAAIVVFLTAWYDVKFAQGTEKPLWMADLKVYLDAARHLVAGGDPWAQNPLGWSYLYPPPTPWMFVPLTKMSVDAAGLIYTVIGVACLGYVIWAALRHVMPAHPRRVFLLAVSVLPFCTWFGPVVDSLELGNIDLIILALLIADFTHLRHTRAHGVLIGIATLIKLQSGLFVVFLLLDKRFRSSINATAVFLVVSLAALVAQPDLSRHYWTSVFPHLSERMGGAPEALYSYSFLSALTRITHDHDIARAIWLPLCAIVLVAGAVLMRRACRNGDEFLAVVLCGLISVSITSLAWVHYWVWLVPLTIVLLVRSVQRGSVPLAVATLGIAAVVHTRTYRFGDLQPLGMNGWLNGLSPLQQLETSTYAIATLAVLPLYHFYLRYVAPEKGIAQNITEPANKRADEPVHEAKPAAEPVLAATADEAR
jgi:alpha-1,2-mannosyltransferase